MPKVGPRQHYLPAAYLGGFSVDPDPSRRRRRLHGVRRPGGTVFTARAERLAVERNLYGDLDAIWGEYEMRLAPVLDRLAKGGMVSGSEWLRTLVPFVAAFLLRGPDFDVRMDDRLRNLGLESAPGNSNAVRPMELRRLLTPVLVSRWIVAIRDPMAGPLMVSDVGWVPFLEPESGEVGIALPLNKDAVLGLVFCRERTVLRWQASTAQWAPVLDYRTLTKETTREFNRLQAMYCQKALFGASEREARAISHLVLGAPPPPQEPGAFGPMSGRPSTVHQNLWFALASNIDRAPDDDDLARFDVSLPRLQDGWCPPVVPYQLTAEEKLAIQLDGGEIRISLFAVTDHLMELGRKNVRDTYGIEVGFTVGPSTSSVGPKPTH